MLFAGPPAERDIQMSTCVDQRNLTSYAAHYRVEQTKDWPGNI
jgi:hypothetical protein